MLNLVPPPTAPDRLMEVRELLHLVETGRSAVWAAVVVVLLLVAVACLAAGFVPLAGLMTGAAMSLALCRYGPHWWPGRR